MQLQPHLLNLSALLQSRLFRIPEYQRAYAWERKQRDDLFSDIKRVIASGEDHFMATIVGLVRDRKCIAADEFTVVEIVDGQQRLTTLIILLKAIEKALNREDKTEAKVGTELMDLLVKGDDFSLLLLQTNHDSTHSFAHYIRDGKLPEVRAETSADQNISDAIFECESFVKNWKVTGGSLIDLLAAIRNKLFAIFHAVDNEALVYRVFEVLNSRGLDVSWIDKLKSQLMGLVFENDDRQSNEATKELHMIWRDIYTTIGLQKTLSTETVRFAGTLKSITLPSRPLDESKSVQRLIELAGNEVKRIVDCANWLQELVRVEADLISNPRLHAVSRIAQVRLLAVAILLAAQHGVFTNEERSMILQRWERVSFRIYGLGDEDARTRVGEYTRLAWRVVNETISAKHVLAELLQIGEGYSIEEVLEGFDASNRYEKWTEELRYLFYRYDEYLASQSNERINELQWRKI